MEIYRSGHTSRDWNYTDSKNSNQISENWTPRKIIVFDGTIDKDGTRHTQIGIQISEKDVQELSYKLFDYYTSRIIELQRTIENLRQNVIDLRTQNEIRREASDTINKIVNGLINPDQWWNNIESPNQESAIEAIKQIAEYASSYSVNTDEKPIINWVEGFEEE